MRNNTGDTLQHVYHYTILVAQLHVTIKYYEHARTTQNGAGVVRVTRVDDHPTRTSHKRMLRKCHEQTGQMEILR